MNKLMFTIFILFFILLNFSIILGINDSKQSINSYFRIHVVANSDSIDDQILKLNISKEINEYILNITSNLYNKEDCVKVITKNINDILNIANDKIIQSGYDYPVVAYIGKLKYDEKTYNEIVMDAGIYDSLKLVIGDGRGENWWSLLFPNSIETYNSKKIIQSDEVTFKSGIFSTFMKLFDRINI